MIFSILILIIGFAVLIKGADWLVEGAASIAKRFGVSNLVIGLTIVAFGTSTPELIVNIFSSIQGTTDIAIGNILGSNIFNIFFILGVSAIIYPLTVQRNTVWKEIPLSLLAALAVGVMANDIFIDGGTVSSLTRIDGIILVFFFIIFIYYTFGIAKNIDAQTADVELEEVKKVRSGFMSVLYIIAGLAALVIGGKWVVDSAVIIAQYFGMSESLIGLTIVAAGTSLPELATSAVAAYKKNSDIAVGNIVGSNIFNIFWILGISAIINPLPFAPQSIFDICATALASLLLMLFMFVGKRHRLDRWEGGLFIIIYIIYIVTIAVRG